MGVELRDAVAEECLRWLPVALGLLYALGLWDADAWVDVAWRAFLRTDFSKLILAEAYVAAFSFAGWIVLFSFVDLLPCLQRYRMAKFASDSRPAHVAAVVVVAILLTLVVLGEPFGRCIPLAGLMAILPCVLYAGSFSALREHAEMPAYALRTYLTFFTFVGSVALFHMVKDPRPAATGPISMPRLVAQVTVGVVAYDFVFSWLHVAMHRFGPRSIDHHRHHKISGFCGRVLALDTVNHSLIDGALQVTVNILVQLINPFDGPKHKLARYLHNVVVTGLLVESHAGYDGFWSSHNLYPRIFGGAKRHVAHHSTGHKYYQQFFTYLDDFLLGKVAT